MDKKQRRFEPQKFQATASEGTPEIQICIPRGPFRIHHDRKRVMRDVYISLAGEQWWLIAADVVEESQARIPKLWRADLYEGIRPNGCSFVLPVTFPRDGSGSDWYDSLSNAAKSARAQWLAVESDHEQQRFIASPARKRCVQEPEWPECDFLELVELAFEDRIIYTAKEAKSKLTRERQKVQEHY